MPRCTLTPELHCTTYQRIDIVPGGASFVALTNSRVVAEAMRPATAELVGRLLSGSSRKKEPTARVDGPGIGTVRTPSALLVAIPV